MPRTTRTVQRTSGGREYIALRANVSPADESLLRQIGERRGIVSRGNVLQVLIREEARRLGLNQPAEST